MMAPSGRVPLREDHRYIGIYLDKSHYNKILLYSRHDFFATPVMAKLADDKIIFTKPELHQSGRKPSKNTFGFYTFGICMGAKDLPPLGAFEFDDEESNEDQIVVYLKKD